MIFHVFQTIAFPNALLPLLPSSISSSLPKYTVHCACCTYLLTGMATGGGVETTGGGVGIFSPSVGNMVVGEAIGA
jgi:hypothetical protein